MTAPEYFDPVQYLTELGHAYRRIGRECERDGQGSSTRRRLDKRMSKLDERFERVLEQWIRPERKAAWRRYFHHGGKPPEEPAIATPPLFRGQTEAGAMIEVRRARSGGYDIAIDGVLTLHHDVPWHLDQEQVQPVQIDQWSCTETFAAADEAISALGKFFAQPGQPPPYPWARDLYEDGIIDAEFALTPRGARRIAKDTGQSSSERGYFKYCVLLANAGRARLLALRGSARDDDASVMLLESIADMSNPALRARDSETLSDTRPGVRREGGHGPRHGVDDRRREHRRELERRFLKRFVDEAAKVWNRSRSCTIVVAAGPRVLGILRPILADHRAGTSRHQIVEVQRDLTLLDAPSLHEALTKLSALPPVRRLPPTRPMRTPNEWQT